MSLNEFEAAMINYQLDKSTNQFQGGWNPFSVASRQELANQVLLCNLSGNDSYFGGMTLRFLLLHVNYKLLFMFLKNQKRNQLL